MDSTAVGIPTLQFDPDRYPHATLKAFNDFIEQFEFRYNAQYPEPSKSAIDNAILKWKASNDREIAEKDIEIIRNEWISKDKVRKLLGFFSSLRLQQDWKAAESNPDILKNATSVKSTSAKSVIPVLEETYDTFGNPTQQKK